MEKEHTDEPLLLRQELPTRPLVATERVPPLPPYLLQRPAPPEYKVLRCEFRRENHATREEKAVRKLHKEYPVAPGVLHLEVAPEEAVAAEVARQTMPVRPPAKAAR